MIPGLHPRYADYFGDCSKHGEARPARKARHVAATVDLVSAIAYAASETFVSELRRKYGWSDMDIRLTIDAGARHVRCDLTTAVKGTANRLLEYLQGVLPAEWTVVLSSCRASHTGTSVYLSSGSSLVTLWRQHPLHGGSHEVATQVLPSDGHLQLLASTSDALLLRSRDGTIGWSEEFGSKRAPIVRCRIHSLDQVARSFLGVPYLLGGTTHAGIDCSGFVQRVYRAAFGIVLPRHSSDQLFVSGASPHVTHGNFLFSRNEETAELHVGIRVNDDVVIHASSSRGVVVEDSLSQFGTCGVDRGSP